MVTHAVGTAIYVRHHLGLEHMHFHRMVIPLILAIDAYYRVEWFHLHSSLAPLLNPIFEGQDGFPFFMICMVIAIIFMQAKGE